VIAVEAGPGGGLRVLFGRPGGIDEIQLDAPGAAPRVVKLIEDDALDPYSFKDRPDLDGDGTKDLLQATYEGIVTWKRAGDGSVSRVAGPRVPPFANSYGEQVTLSGRLILTPVPPELVRWTWPETLPGRRLRVYRAPLPPATGDVCAAWIDAGAQLYAARAVILSGAPPRLAALVAPSDKIAIFGNLSLLVAPLTCDETARGRQPTLVAKTAFEANIGWTLFAARDVTGDGRLDLLYFGQQGLLDEKLQVAVHHGLADGSFGASPAIGERSDLEPISARWENDVDGDGLLDLVVLDPKRALLARGRAVAKTNELPVDLQKAAVVELPENVRPRRLVELIDFDGDGRLEALIAGETREEKSKKDKAEVRVGGAIPRAEKDAQLVIVRFPTTNR
jgi:hypothetical protein